MNDLTKEATKKTKTEFVFKRDLPAIIIALAVTTIFFIFLSY